MVNQNAVIVGGGVCGLVSSLLLKKRGYNVVLIEQAERIGGLFCSIKDSKGAAYDMGSHIPNATGIEELDQILFGHVDDKSQWNTIDKLESGNYFSGSWDLTSPFPNAQKLEPAVYSQGCGELINLTHQPSEQFIYDHCINSLGVVFTHSIVVPILQKLYGKLTDIRGLTMEAGLFGFTRILALPADVAAQLKELPAFDSKLGYQTEQDFLARKERDKLSDVKYFYPNNGEGIGHWVQELLAHVEKAGVEVITSERVKKIVRSGTQITHIELASDRVLSCDLLFWSAPPFIALNALGIEPQRGQMELRTAVIFHLNFDKPLTNQKSHYLWVWDSSTDIFRLTLYPNLDKSVSHHHLSAEILCSPDEVSSYLLEDVVAQLKAMCVIDEDAQVISSQTQVINNTFPVPTKEFKDVNLHNFELLDKSVDNLIVSGRYSGKCWRQADVLIDAYNSIKEL
ncbi:FAD-dependent oxidoreductase [Pseudoalteromonas luteoviolacea]|uniref:NAD(P)-binding protein n=1 Tax=Pseudoalteromonas luteoviolacea TaxID=43657 RepID=UPI001B3A178B|nr:NAD(P)-binding protein [Pseudoalteromonas luteoviolacea]MBQ4879339.1 FAD-dependent oxidoreductase [Pseudoalteromonas luteoviolacea]MBQ4908399.1 FAD-dependent oxidoreductase [Pseudoalteromonas luteoviolacea]